ncbi:MAG: hypothetical protein ACYC77_05635 [Coriobacteriia bacterium]
MRARIGTIIVLAAITVALVVPATAFALPQDAVLLRSETHTVSGVELANQVLTGMSGVTLGSSGATVTLDVDGQSREIGIGLSDVAPAWGGGFGGIAIVAGAGIAVMRFAAKIVRIFG